MADPCKRKLINLGPEILADALLNLSLHSDDAANLIEQLVATPKENVQRFKKKLTSLKHSRRFIEWRGSASFARELEMLLQDLKAGVIEPTTGIELVAAFFEADSTILEMCDDSSGYIGDIFRDNAKELFIEYATCCVSKQQVADVILNLNQIDNYGVRDVLIDCAGVCLPDGIIRTMITTLQMWASKENRESGKRHYFHAIESLARQINDPKLFETTRIACWGKLSTASIIDIANVYWESGDVETSHFWLKKIPEGETYHERDKLLEKIYERQGDFENLTVLLHQKFRTCHSIDALQALLKIIGYDKRDEVIADEVANIMKIDKFRECDAEFLIEIGKMDEAEAYLLERAEQLDGKYYDSLLVMAKAMESKKCYLAASLIYRSLLVSILERGNTSAYSHGIRYLKKLDKLAQRISDWKDFNGHEAFKHLLFEAHGRKRSFWSNYEEKR